MLQHNKKMILEGLLFIAGDEGLNETQILSCMEDEMTKVELSVLLDEMMQDYLNDERGFELVRFGGIYKFVSKEVVHPYAERLFSSTKISTLSQAALETLAIIAYKQPITRAEIEEIRGVGCDMMIRKLLARSLIKECGRSDAPGRPFLYEVTSEFMDVFKLESLKELPDLPTFRDEEDNELFDEEA